MNLKNDSAADGMMEKVISFVRQYVHLKREGFLDGDPSWPDLTEDMPNGQPIIDMLVDHHDRQLEARFSQTRLNRKAVAPRHMQVENDAIRLMGFQGIKKFGAGGKGFHIEAGRTQQTSEGDAHGFLIVHDGNQRTGFTHRIRHYQRESREVLDFGPIGADSELVISDQ